jgi:uncharacterized membrane protein YgcG
LAEAYVETTSNPILGADQTSEQFRASFLRAFASKYPARYADREKQPLKNKFATMAQDVLKFNGVLLEVRGMQPTGVTEDDIFRIAVARHVEKFKSNSCVSEEANIYNFKSFDVSVWIYSAACKALHTIPNFNPESVAADRPGGNAATVLSDGSRDDETTPSAAVGGPASIIVGECAVGSATDTSPVTNRRAKRGGQVCRQAAKVDAASALRQQQAVRCLSRIGESLKRKSVALEEANAMHAFRVVLDGETEEDRELKRDFLRALRRKHMNAAMEAFRSEGGGSAGGGGNAGGGGSGSGSGGNRSGTRAVTNTGTIPLARVATMPPVQLDQSTQT